MRTRIKATPRKTQPAVIRAVEAVFSPLAQLLVEHGVSSPESEALLRAVCVHEAAKAEVSRGKKPNISRIALVTGVDRGEVARILERPPGAAPAIDTGRHRVNRVLNGWHSDRRFFDRKRPLVLPIKNSRNGPSFWSLASRYAPGVYPGLILAELCRVKAVEKLEGERVRVRMRRYKAKALSHEVLCEVGSRVGDLLQTILNNATHAKSQRICRMVQTTNVDAAFLPLIRKMLADRSQAMLGGVQEELNSSRWKQGGSNGPRVRIGLTIYSHEGRVEESGANKSAKYGRVSRRPTHKSRKGEENGSG